MKQSWENFMVRKSIDKITFGVFVIEQEGHKVETASMCVCVFETERVSGTARLWQEQNRARLVIIQGCS